MTTVPEIRKLVQPFVARYPAMVHSGRLLVFRPIGHLMRTLAFWGGSDRHNPGLGWMLCPLVIPPGLMNTFGNHIPVGYTNWPGFQGIFHERTYRVIEWYLLPNTTISDFCELGWDRHLFRQGTLSKNFPTQHAVLLASIGRFDEAAAVLAGPLVQLRQSVEAQLNEGRALLAKRANSKIAKFDIEQAESDRSLAASLERLLEHLHARDGAGVAALLREWELQNVRHWGVEQHWQPTPFPFEAG